MKAYQPTKPLECETSLINQQDLAEKEEEIKGLAKSPTVK
jgi:hypothetical protein